ncbi:MAG: hypothetical protein ABJG78_13205 [Cyclobacteriaceae bacterium]
MKSLTSLLFGLILISCNQTQQQTSKSKASSHELTRQPCIERMVSWNYQKKDFKDSLISLRQLNQLDTNTLIICGSFFPELELKMYKYFKESIDVFNGKIRSSLLGITKHSDSTFVVNYSLLIDSTQQAVEMRRLLVKDGEVIGINVIPTIFNGFTSIEEFNQPIEEGSDVIIEEAEPNKR